MSFYNLQHLQNHSRASDFYRQNSHKVELTLQHRLKHSRNIFLPLRQILSVSLSTFKQVQENVHYQRIMSRTEILIYNDKQRYLDLFSYMILY